MEPEPWDWIPHVEGVDRQREINAYLRDLIDKMPVAVGPMMRWNPNTSQMEPFRYDDYQKGK